MTKKIYITTAVIMFISASCSVSHILAHRDITASLSQSHRKIDTSESNTLQRPLRVEHKGDSVFLVETEKLDGENIASIKAETVKVVGGVKNLAERNGFVQISFNVILPETMLGSDRFIVLYPILYKLDKNDSMIFKPVIIRGGTMDILQQRESWQMSLYYQRFKQTIEESYKRFIRFPQMIDTKLDTVIERMQEITYSYQRELPSTMISKRMSLIMKGEVRSIDGSIYRIPSKDTLGFIVSSMLSFVDTTTKYKTRIIDKYVSISKRYNICFSSGSYTLDNDDKEFQKLMELQMSLRNSAEYEIDSVILVASSSPEGKYTLNERLTKQRANSLSDLVKPNRIVNISENWDELRDSIKKSQLVSSTAIMKIISNTDDPDLRENRIRILYPREYQHIKSCYYPSLRFVSTRYYLRRKGMEKDTIHLEEVDTIYMKALEMLQKRHYYEALEILKPYQDHNTAITLMSLGYDNEAKKIILIEKESPEREYLLSILCSRLNEIEEGRKHYINACRMNSRMEFRGNLDPEINKLLKK